MQKEELRAIFDQQAGSYDARQDKMAPVLGGLHFLMNAVFSSLPANASILSVRAGTGAEIIYLAKRFPHWAFTAVEPSGPMLEVCRHRAEEEGIASRCTFHAGYLDTLPQSEPFDGATSLLVSQFILEREARTDFFRAIAERLKPGGILVNSDLSSGLNAATYEDLLEVWVRMMGDADVPAEKIANMRATYAKDVGILPSAEVIDIISAGGFETPIQFFQAALIHAWYTRRTSDGAEQ